MFTYVCTVDYKPDSFQNGENLLAAEQTNSPRGPRDHG